MSSKRAYPVEKDGVSFEVRASSPEEARAIAERTDVATVPRVIGKNGSTRVFERPDGQRYVLSPGGAFSDPNRVEAALSGMTSDQLMTQSFDESTIDKNPIAARANEFIRGIPFVGSLADEFAGKILGQDATAGMRATTGAMQRQRPGETLGLNLAGGLAGGIAGAAGLGALAPGTVSGLTSSAIGTGSRASKVLRGAAAGAAAGGVEGGIYGSGEGTNAQERVAEAGRGVKFGTVGGAAFGGAAPVVSEVAGNVIGLFRRSDINQIAREFGISASAARVIKNTFDQGGDIDAAVLNLERAGSEAMLADAGPAAQALLDATAASGGTAGPAVRGAIDERMARSGSNITAALNRALGEADDPEALRRGIVQGTKAERQAAYDAAFGKEIDWFSPAGAELRALLETTPPEVLTRAARNARMGARASSTFPDYSDDFAPEITFPSGQAGRSAAREAEAKEVSDFFEALNASSGGSKKPFTAQIKRMGGIDPTGVAAEELRRRGVTSQTHPALFKVGGMKEVDNLVANELFDGLPPSDSYADPEDIYTALANEGRGVPTNSAGNAADRSDNLELLSLEPEYIARRDALAADDAVERGLLTAPPAPSNAYPVQTVRDVDQIKRSLDEIYRTNDGQGLLGGQTDFGRLAGQRATETRDLLKEAVPEYGSALDVASDAITRTNAVEFGASLLRPATSRDAVRQFVNRASPPEIYAAQSGLRGQIDEIVSNVRAIPSDPNMDARQALSALSSMSSDSSRSKMALILGDEAPALFSQLDEAAQSATVRAAMAQNSKTAGRQAIIGTVDELTAPGVVGQAMQGEAVNTTKAMIQAVTGQTAEYTATQRQRIYQDIARALTEKSGENALTSLRVLDAAMKGQSLTEMQTDQLAQMLAGVLFGGATTGATRGATAESRQDAIMVPREPLRMTIDQPANQ